MTSAVFRKKSANPDSFIMKDWKIIKRKLLIPIRASTCSYRMRNSGELRTQARSLFPTLFLHQFSTDAQSMFFEIANSTVGRFFLFVESACGDSTFFVESARGNPAFSDIVVVMHVHGCAIVLQLKVKQNYEVFCKIENEDAKTKLTTARRKLVKEGRL